MMALSLAKSSSDFLHRAPPYAAAALRPHTCASALGADQPSSEAQLGRFAELTRGKMALLISHRFSTTKMADRVLVPEQGRIAEHGHHEQIVHRSGSRCAQMFELQAANCR